MYERFTDRARKVMLLAHQQAHRYSHEYVSTEHILLGLVKEESGVAARVLRNLGVDRDRVRLAVEKTLRPGYEQGMGRLPLTPDAAKVIEHASDEARQFNHNYIGTEHLMLGLLRTAEGSAADPLTALGLDLNAAREHVRNLSSPDAPMTAGPVDRLAVLTTPYDLTAEHLQIVYERIRLLQEQKDAFVAAENFAPAARCRDEAEALDRLLAWYEWSHYRERP